MGVLHLNGAPLLFGGVALHFGGGPTATADINIIKRSYTEMAPEAFVFGINNMVGFTTPAPTGGEIYDERFHSLYYFWDFGDDYNFAAPTRLTDKAAGQQTGPWGAHTYRAAGNYDVTCTIYEPSTGDWAIATTTITVSAAISDANTIFMSPGGSFGNAPAGATQVTNGDIDAVIVSNIEGQEATPKRLMLNRGEAYTFSGYNLGFGTDIPTLHIVAGPGGGANPTVTVTGGFDWNDTATATSGGEKDFVIQNIDWHAPFDPTDNTGAEVNFWTCSGANKPAFALFDGLIIDGFGLGTFGGGNFDVFNDCNFGGYKTTAINTYQDLTTGALAVTGTAFHAPEQAWVDVHGGLGATYRGQGAYAIFSKIDSYNRQGNTANTGHHQANGFRMNGEGEEGCHVLMTESVLEGGIQVVQAKEGGYGAGRSNILIEKNHLLGCFSSYNMIGICQAGTTIRNNLCVFPNITYNVPGPASFVALDYLGNDTLNKSAPIDVYSNTFINLSTQSADGVVVSDAFSGGQGAFDNTTDHNNVIHQPNLGSPVTTYAPLSDTVSVFAPFNNYGYVDSGEGPLYDRATPQNKLAYDAQTGNFTVGDILTGGTSGATARIVGDDDDGTTGTLWLGPITNGPFQNNETITDATTGSATANGASADAAQTATYAPTSGSSAIAGWTTGNVAYDDFYGVIRPGTPSIGAFEEEV